MSEIYKYDSIDYSKLNFSKPEKQNNIYYSDINYDGNPFYLLTSKLDILSNIKEINKNSPSIEFEIVDKNLDLYDTFNQIDDKIIKTTYDNSFQWFKQKIPLEVIDDMYKRLTKPLKKNKNPTIRFKLPISQNKILCKIYNQNKDFIDINQIKDNSSSILILHIRGIKFMKQQYICDCYITQMKVFIPKQNKYIIPDECLIDESFCTQSDEDIIDEEIIQENNIRKKKLINKKKLELEKLKYLQEKINNMDISINNL